MKKKNEHKELNKKTNDEFYIMMNMTLDIWIMFLIPKSKTREVCKRTN